MESLRNSTSNTIWNVTRHQATSHGKMNTRKLKENTENNNTSIGDSSSNYGSSKSGRPKLEHHFLFELMNSIGKKR